MRLKLYFIQPKNWHLFSWNSNSIHFNYPLFCRKCIFFISIKEFVTIWWMLLLFVVTQWKSFTFFISDGAVRQKVGYGKTSFLKTLFMYVSLVYPPAACWPSKCLIPQTHTFFAIYLFVFFFFLGWCEYYERIALVGSPLQAENWHDCYARLEHHR